MQIQAENRPLTEPSVRETHTQLTDLAKNIESAVQQISIPLTQKIESAIPDVAHDHVNTLYSGFSLGRFVEKPPAAELTAQPQAESKESAADKTTVKIVFQPEVTFDIRNTAEWFGRSVTVKEGDLKLVISYKLENGNSSISVASGEEPVYWVRMKDGNLYNQNFQLDDSRKRAFREPLPAEAIEIATRILSTLNEGLTALQTMPHSPAGAAASDDLALKVVDYEAV